MTTKTAEKPQTKPQQKTVPSGEDMQAIYRCHTLAQILYRHIAMTQPWVMQGTLPTFCQPAVGPFPWMPGWPQTEQPPMQ